MLPTKSKISQLVINWHLTEACNYRCQYCYATWAKDESSRDVVHDRARSESLITDLYKFFQPGNTDNPLYNHMQWETVRINFAGGEPLIYDKKISHLVTFAKNTGFKVSLITNASRLSSELISELAPHLSWFGLSIDSSNERTNRSIGRVNQGGAVLNLEQLSKDIKQVRLTNPNFRLKINTVVNACNWTEDFSPLINLFAPEKWKVLRMLPVVNEKLMVSDQQFNSFVDRNASVSDAICVEDNADMLGSYIMIDPQGRFYQNGSDIIDAGYQYSKSIIKEGAAVAFSGMRFAADRFAARY